MTKHRHEKAWGTIATVATATTLALTLACSEQPGDEARRTAAAREKQYTRTDGDATLGTRSVTGTVRQVVDDGIVVYGREKGESEREWAIVLESDTRLDRGVQLTGAGSLREGDPVTVVFTNRDGKIVARSVTSAPSEIPAASGNR